MIVSALTTHEKSAALAQAGSTALAKIAGNDDVKTAIRESGGISLILSVMQAHPKRAGVLEQGCAAVAALCLRCPTNATAVAAESGPHIIVKVRPQPRPFCCGRPRRVHVNLALPEDCGVAYVLTNSSRALLISGCSKAMHMHPDHAKLQTTACGCC